MSGFDELRDRVASLTGLNKRAAASVATSLLATGSQTEFSAGAIVGEAESLGYEFERPEGVKVEREPAPFAAEVTMDAGTVLSEVYEAMPRVLCAQPPRVGKAPEELRRLDPELVDQLPEEVRALLVKIDVLEGKATFWLYDEANQIDRPIGPIDLTRYDSAEALHEAFGALLRRLPKVLAADHN